MLESVIIDQQSRYGERSFTYVFVFQNNNVIHFQSSPLLVPDLSKLKDLSLYLHLQLPIWQCTFHP